MFRRRTPALTALTAALALTLSACGSSEDAAAPSTEPTSAEATTEATSAAPQTTAPEETPAAGEAEIADAPAEGALVSDSGVVAIRPGDQWVANAEIAGAMAPQVEQIGGTVDLAATAPQGPSENGEVVVLMRVPGDVGREGLDSFVRGLRDSMGPDAAASETQEIEVAGAPGVLVSASTDVQGTPMNFDIAGVVRDDALYALMTVNTPTASTTSPTTRQTLDSWQWLQ